MITGSGKSICTDYVLRLAERFDGCATHIDGSYVATGAVRVGDVLQQTTRDPKAAMRFAECGAAKQFCTRARTPEPSDVDGPLTGLMRAYDVDVVAVRRLGLEPVTGVAMAGRLAR